MNDIFLLERKAQSLPVSLWDYTKSFQLIQHDGYLTLRIRSLILVFLLKYHCSNIWPLFQINVFSILKTQHLHLCRMLFQHNLTETFSFHLEIYLSKFEAILQTQFFFILYSLNINILEVILQLLKGNSDKTYYVEGK